MKEYKKTHENLFTAERSLKYCKLDKIEFSGWDETEESYSDFFNIYMRDVFSSIWMMCVRTHWLICKFIYDGKKRTRTRRNGMIMDRALGIFIRHYIGIDIRPITRSYFYNKIISYFGDFFPDFHKNNPFKDPELYAFPYENINIDYLLVVYQMPERLDILKLVDKKGLKYTQFLDYILNHILSANEEAGKNLYDFMMVETIPPYVRYNKFKKYGKR